MAMGPQRKKALGGEAGVPGHGGFQGGRAGGCRESEDPKSAMFGFLGWDAFRVMLTPLLISINQPQFINRGVFPSKSEQSRTPPY